MASVSLGQETVVIAVTAATQQSRAPTAYLSIYISKITSIPSVSPGLPHSSHTAATAVTAATQQPGNSGGLSILLIQEPRCNRW